MNPYDPISFSAATAAEAFAVLQCLRDGAVVLDDCGQVRLWNAAATDLLGYRASDVISKRFSEIAIPERHSDNAGYASVISLIDPPESPIELRLRTQTGREIWVELSISPLPLLSSDGRAESMRVLLMRDAESRKQHEMRLKHEARKDSLSGLANRREFQSVLESNQARALTLAIIDIDLFKSVNDNFGHPVGDASIRAVAAALKAEFQDALCIGRLGGDEFGVLVLTDLIDWESRFRELQLRLQGILLGATQQLTVSMGVALAKETASARQLLSVADQALYAAKNSGRNAVRLRDVDN